MLSSWFFFKLKKRIWIINIFKTVIFLKIILQFLRFLVNNEMPFWFVSFEHTKEFLFQYHAKSCGEFACTKKWVRGFLSNFKSIQKAVSRYAHKSYAHKNSAIKTFLIKNWIFTRYSWPRGIFLSNIPLNYVICKEATDISLPVVAMVDTDIKSYLFNYPIPSNDDSFISVSFIISILSKQILSSKYKKVLAWYSKYKITKLNTLKLFQNINDIKLKQLKKTNIKRFFLKIMRNKFFYNTLNLTLFNNYSTLKSNIKKFFNSNIITKSPSPLNIEPLSTLLVKKLYFLKKFGSKLNFNNKILKKRIFSNSYNPLNSLKKATILNKLKRRKKEAYFRYFSITSLIKQTRLFHESFIINKPSDLKFLRFFEKIEKKTKLNKKDNFFYFKDYKVKLDTARKEKWLNNSFNKRLLADKKAQNNSYFSDAAIVLNVNRWVYPKTLFNIMRKLKRTILNYWLIPFIKRFSIRDEYSWYHSKFWHKEDNVFRRSITWAFSRDNINIPVSALNYYSNWFLNLFRSNKYNFFFRKKKRLKNILFLIF
jgi:small subunit ribosomal protein S2